MKKINVLFFAFLMCLSVLLFNSYACEKEKAINIENAEQLENAFNNGGNYALTQNIESEEGFAVKENVEVFLDLNGHSIVCDNEGASIENNGKLTLKNGTVYSTNIEAQSRMAIKNNGEFFGENLTLGSKQSRGNAIRNFGQAEIINSTFDCCNNYINGNGYAYAVANSSGNMIIKNCAYSGSANGVFAADGGKIKIDGGTYVLDGEKPYYMFYLDEGEITVNSGNFAKTNGGSRPLAYSTSTSFDNLIINGGTIFYNGEVWTK